MSRNYDCIIVGSGPAGISASLYTLRAGFSTLLFSTQDSALRRAERIENYYGFSQGISGEELLREGEKQARRLGAEMTLEAVGSTGAARCCLPRGRTACAQTLKTWRRWRAKG